MTQSVYLKERKVPPPPPRYDAHNVSRSNGCSFVSVVIPTFPALAINYR